MDTEHPFELAPEFGRLKDALVVGGFLHVVEAFIPLRFSR